MKPTTSKRYDHGRARLARYGLLVALTAAGSQALAQTPAPAASEQTEEDVVVLSEFQVNTEKDYGYRASNSIAGTRTNTPIKEIPMNIQVFTKELVEDLGIKNQVDLEAYNASLVNGAADRFSDNVIQQAYQQFLFRGFQQNWGLRDGVREYDPIDTHGLARVEVVKGPAAALYGLAYPGGVMQNISKQVEFTRPFADFRFTLGTYGDYRATADINTISTVGNQSFGIRYNGVYEQTEDERAHSRGEINFHQVNLAWRLSDKTNLEFLVEEASRFVPNGLQGRFEQPEGDGSNRASIPIQEIKNIPYTWNWSDGKAVRGLETSLIRGAITQKFTDQFQVRAYMQYSERMELPGNGWDANGSGGADSWENGGGWIRDRDVIRSTYQVRDWGNKMHAYGATGVYKLDFDAVKNTFAFGANVWYEDEESRAWGPRDLATTPYWVEVPAEKGVKIVTPKRPPVDIIPYSDGGPNGNGFHHEDNSNDYYFVNWQGSFLDERLHTNVGFNKTNLKLVTWNNGASTAPENEYEASKVSPMYGAVFDINKNISVFGLYATSLFPDSSKDSFGNQFSPQVGKSIEAGFKLELMDGKISGTVSYYQITQTGGSQRDPNADNTTTARWDSLTPAQRAADTQFTNGSTEDPDDFLPRANFTGDQVAGGEQESTGIDFDLIFQPSRNWQIMASVATVDHEFTVSAIPETIGQTYPQAIKTRYALLTKYSFLDGGLKGLNLGLGLHGGTKALMDYVTWNGESVARYEPARQTVDVFATYSFLMFERNSFVQLNVRNLLGEDDYAGWQATGSPTILATKRYAVPLDPVVRLTFGVKF